MCIERHQSALRSWFMTSEPLNHPVDESKNMACSIGCGDGALFSTVGVQIAQFLERAHDHRGIQTPALGTSPARMPHAAGHVLGQNLRHLAQDRRRALYRAGCSASWNKHIRSRQRAMHRDSVVLYGQDCCNVNPLSLVGWLRPLHRCNSIVDWLTSKGRRTTVLYFQL